MAMIQFFIDDWKEFAERNNGSCKLVKTAPGLGGGCSWLKLFMKFPIANSNIEVVTSEASSIKIYFDFKKDIDKEFLIYPEDFDDRIGKLFGFGEVEIDNSRFDEIYFIKSKDDEFIKYVLNNTVANYLIKINKRVANFKLETIKDFSILELNAPFDESNINMLADALEFMKKVIASIIKYEN